MKLYNPFLKYVLLFFTGGFSYVTIEILTRGYSHISMLIAGGICFILIGLINEIFPWNISLISQMLLSSIIVTSIELITGIIVNLILKLNVWDYSALPYNFLGQICLPFSALWFLLSFVAIIFDDYFKYFFLGGRRPHYKVF